MRNVSFAAVALLCSILSACGGGGGGGEGGPQPPAPPTSTAPEITAHPQSATITDGQPATFTLVASGSPPLMYQWQRDGVVIPGATSASYAFTATLVDDQTQYRAVVSNSAGSTLSLAATLQVTAVAPAITMQPQPQAVLAATSATFSVTASGSGTLAFQWLRNGVPIAGATNMVYTTPVLTLADAGQNFSVIVSNQVGSVTSNAASLQVDPVPNAIVIDTQPQNAAVGEGDVATFTVSASGTGPLTYQWRRNGAPIPGEYEATLTIAPATAFDNGDQYSVEVRNTVGLASSASANLAVTPGAISLLLGNVRGWGYRDGHARLAKFGCARGIVGDGAGDYLVTDALNSVVRRISAAGSVSTFVGLARPDGSADGTGANARFDAPTSITRAANGNLYIVDSGNHTIRQVTPAGVVTTLAGSPGAAGAADGQGAGARFNLESPAICEGIADSGIVADASGNLFIADTNNHAIRRVTPGGAVSTFAGALGQQGGADGSGAVARFAFPAGITIDAAQDLYVYDPNGHIRRITPAGEVTTLPGSATSNGAILADAGGELFFTSVATVYRYTGTNGPVVIAGNNLHPFASENGRGSAALFASPFALAFTPASELLVADRSSVRRIDQRQGVSTFAGSLDFAFGFADGPARSAMTRNIAGIAADAGGNLVLVDKNNNAIRRLSASGVLTTIAGVPQQPGDTDGTLTQARFNQPEGVALDNTGSIYLTDNVSHTVRKISTSAQVTTIGGVATLSGTADGPIGTSRFNKPMGLAVDGAGNVYVADADNHAIRRIDGAGNTTTFVGQPGSAGAVNGNGATARFNRPEAVAIAASGDLYVIDAGNFAVRRVTPTGDVTTFAGALGLPGTADGTGSVARFSFPRALTVDGGGNLYLVDDVGTVRRISSTAVVTTVAGNTIDWGASVGPLPGTFSSLKGIALAPSSGTTKLFVGTNSGVFSVTLP